MTALLICIAAFVYPSWSSAKTIFESYYRVEIDRKHVGYVVQQLSEEPRTKARTLKGYVQLDQGGGTIWQEFALTSKAGAPAGAIYRSNESGDLKTVSATFSKSGAKVTAQNGKRRRSEAIGDIGLISGLLFYSADLAAVKKDASYSYQAYSEERGRIARGSVVLMNKDVVGGKTVLQLADEFLGQTVENFVSPDGIPLGSRVDSAKLVTYWVPDRAAAVGVLEFPEAKIKKFFGDVPKGQTSPWGEIPDGRADVVLDKFARPPFDRPAQPSRSLSLPLRKS